mmetsp:Transcript_10982/g.19865  ORF Transcript_10982/g.19865 Transcript_10982/m.19865 type:complete len:149 (-) Transcript_10982:30-476(-)
MGAGASQGMAGFSNLSESDYDALNFPSTPPPYQQAMDLAARFGSFSLDEDLSCVQCGKGVEKGRSYSMDEMTDGFVEESKDAEGKEEEEEGGELPVGDPRESPFSYEGRGYCNLECFFCAHKTKPGLCMYVDKLATVMFEYQRSQERK